MSDELLPEEQEEVTAKATAAMAAGAALSLLFANAVQANGVHIYE
jgi:hypothetical protein